MRQPGWFLAILILGVSSSQGVSGAPASARSFEDCYRAALHRSEAFAGQSELVFQAEERLSQARSGILPSVSAIGTQTWQEAPASSVGSSLFPAVQPLVKLTATQPLFRGFREFAGIRATGALHGAAIESRRHAATLLYTDVAQAFFSVLSQEQELRNLEGELRLVSKRVSELKERKRIGRSRLSEVLSTEATVSALKAQIETLKGSLGQAREVLSFLTGFGNDVRLEEPREPRPPAQGLDLLLFRVDERPDVRAELKKLQAAEENISVARGAHLPSVDLSGNSYFIRSGSLKDVNWDATLSVSLPIYAGGAIASRAREAASQSRQAALGFSRARRLAEQEIRSLHELLQADEAQLKALGSNALIQERNFEEVSRDYKLGLVTNLEVLQALTGFQQSRRAYDRARYSARLERARLDAATGLAPEIASALDSVIGGPLGAQR